MKHVALIPRDGYSLEPELADCIECLFKSGIYVYASHRGPGYAILWADDSVISQGMQVFHRSAFDAAPLPG